MSPDLTSTIVRAVTCDVSGSKFPTSYLVGKVFTVSFVPLFVILRSAASYNARRRTTRAQHHYPKYPYCWALTLLVSRRVDNTKVIIALVDIL